MLKRNTYSFWNLGKKKSSTMSTKEFLEKITKKVIAASSSTTGAVNGYETHIRLSIAGKIPVKKETFEVVRSGELQEEQTFTIKYVFPTPITASELAALPVIVDSRTDSAKMGDRNGVRNLRINDSEDFTEQWSLGQWRPEYLLGPRGYWLFEKDEKKFAEIKSKYRVRDANEDRILLEKQVLGEGRGIKIVTMTEQGEILERMVTGNFDVQHERENPGFREDLERVSKHAFSFDLWDQSSSPITSISYDLVTYSMSMTVGLERGSNTSKLGKELKYNLFLHLNEQSMLAPSFIQKMHQHISVKATVTGRIGFTSQRSRMEMKSTYYTARSNAASSSSSVQNDDEEEHRSVWNAASSTKQIGMKFEGSVYGYPAHEKTTFQCSVIPRFKMEMPPFPFAIFVIDNVDVLPTSPALIARTINVTANSRLSIRSQVGMLPSKLSLKRTLPTDDAFDATVDTNVVYIADDNKNAKLTAYVNQESFRDKLIPTLYLSKSSIEEGSKRMEIEVSRGGFFTVVILFSSKLFSDVKSFSGEGFEKINMRSRNDIFLGARGSEFEQNTIENGVRVTSAPEGPKTIDLTLNFSLEYLRSKNSYNK